MRKYDFLFAYEIKNRELESVCLLKYELERRGYSVAVIETMWAAQPCYRPISASVLVTFALYNDSQLLGAVNYGRNFKTIVNLQWEQIYTNADEEKLDSLYHISGNARDMIHIAWGPFTVAKLVHVCGVPSQNVKMTGHIAMDFIKPRFHGYYMEREELFRRYHISMDTKLLLFISTFSFVDIPDAVLKIDSFENTGMPVRDFKKFSILSQTVLFQWLRDILPHHPECIFIYRPHPTEIYNPEFREIEKSIPNFRVIRDYSVKQWITVADKVYTWYSTSAADAYFCGKSFEILRPVEAPHEIELVLFNGGRFVTTPQDFDRTIDSPDEGLPIKKEVFDSFYVFHEETYVYTELCNVLEEAFCDPADHYKQFRGKPKYNLIFRIIRFPLRIAKHYCLKLLGWMYTVGFFKQAGGLLAEQAKNQAYVREMIQNNYANKREILTLQNRIREIVESNMNRYPHI